MTQSERRAYLIQALLEERKQYAGMEVPVGEREQKRLLCALFNIRMPQPAGKEFLAVQDAYLQEELRQKGVTDLKDLRPVQDEIYLWQGDITTLRCGAIVNAANSQLLGCFIPCHGCIDNAIHTYAGVQLRSACAEIMYGQGEPEATGTAKITPAFNLPCDYVLHTVGPVGCGRPTGREEDQLASCYRSCLELAEQNGVESIAFCCISTGEFHFPNDRAAQIAFKTVKEYKKQTNSAVKVIFNVFKQSDFGIYRQLLELHKKAEN